MASLMLHCGSGPADRDRLYGVNTPPSTDTYTAVPFGVIRDMLVAAARTRRLLVAAERWGLSRGDRRAFGVITFYDDDAPDGPGQDTTLGMAVGLRASHDRSLPIGFCAGGHLFVCDNLCFTADGLVEMRRHTRNVMADLDGMIERVLDVLVPTLDAIEHRRDLFIGTTVDDVAGLGALGVMYGHGVITNRQFTVAVEHWIEPPDAFLARDAWSLYNSVTEGLKHGEAGTLLGRHIDAERWLCERFEVA
jgi:hypothetical protein